VFSGAGGGGHGEQGVSAGAPASSGPGQVGVPDHGLVAAVGGVGLLAAVPVAAGGAQRAHRCGVAAALGSEVAAVAEHVRPAAQRLEVFVGVAAQLETGADQPPMMGAGVRGTE
jgi:hypothetical protein